MNEFGYTKEQGIKLLDDFLLPRGYQRSEDFDEDPSWYKLYDCEDEDFVYIAAVIDLDLTARLEPVAECGLYVKSYWWELENSEDEVPEFIENLKLARKEVAKDLDEAYKAFQDAFMEKKPDDVYTLVYTYDNYGLFDEDGIPGVRTTDETEWLNLDRASKELYTLVSFNDEVQLYRGNTDITNEILSDESLFKKFYDDKEALEGSDFKYLAYEQAWRCVKEYAKDGYSETIEKYIGKGIIH